MFILLYPSSNLLFCGYEVITPRACVRGKAIAVALLLAQKSALLEM
jgi:hypothetical protein